MKLDKQEDIPVSRLRGERLLGPGHQVDLSAQCRREAVVDVDLQRGRQRLGEFLVGSLVAAFPSFGHGLAAVDRAAEELDSREFFREHAHAGDVLVEDRGAKLVVVPAGELLAHPAKVPLPGVRALALLGVHARRQVKDVVVGVLAGATCHQGASAMSHVVRGGHPQKRGLAVPEPLGREAEHVARPRVDDSPAVDVLLVLWVLLHRGHVQVLVAVPGQLKRSSDAVQGPEALARSVKSGLRWISE